MGTGRDGPRALVVGAAGGIGRAIVKALVADGHRVAAVDRAEIVDRDVAHTIIADLRAPEACAGAVAASVEALGGLDVLVHAAGISRDAVLWKLAPDDWRDVMATNLDSAFHLCRVAIPALRAAGGGAIALIASIEGQRGRLGLGAYSASKAGLIGLTRTLARETGRFGIRVNAVAPGFIRTPMTAELQPELIRTAIEESCLGRLGEPEEVASAVRFLVSPEAAYVTGEVLRVDGGQRA